MKRKKQGPNDHKEEAMRRYETIVIVRPGAGDTEFSAVSDKVTGTIEGFNGSIVRTDRWGLKKLAYPIKKETQGDFLYVEYAGLPDGVKEMERLIRIDDRVLKFMTVKTQDVFTPDAPKTEDAEELEATPALTDEASE
ncbi:MAG: 30S ribosomal protein S6 [Desulfobulbaceae bacterium]|nr:30S ribosomal protein S6 [Desulfobulbaceae bacterium]